MDSRSNQYAYRANGAQSVMQSGRRFACAAGEYALYTIRKEYWCDCSTLRKTDEARP